MTTLTGRPNTALAVIDVQVGVVADAHQRDQVVANIATLVDQAREQGTPVVWVLHSHPEFLPRDSEKWQLVPELKIGDGEPVVHKTFPDSFEETDLEEVLAALEVGRLVVSGAQTDECIRSTLHGAVARGYDATLVSDAHTTEDQSEYGAPTPDLVIAHTNLYWTYHRAPGREAGTVTTADPGF
jgi:nicotinamidase-related amidase